MKRLLLFVTVAILGLAQSVIGQWTTDSTINTAVCTAVGDQIDLRAIGDGTGGIIIVWEDYRPGQYNDLYAQRIDVSGVVQWTTNGVAVCSASGYQTGPAICSDGSGGAFITWWDRRNEGPDGIYVQRINGSGVAQWTANGVIICDQNVIAPVIAYDGNGGAVVAWQDSRNLGVANVYAQRIDGSGNTHWTSNGLKISNAAGSQQTPMIVNDGAGGAIIGWPNPNAGNFALYAQRVSSAGAVKWGAAGTVICGAANEDLSLYPAMIADGNGGAVFAWEDDRNTTNNDLYAQRVDSNGVVRWTANGVPICSMVRNQRSAALASDGKGGALIAWRDERRSIFISDIYAQLIDSSGVLKWTANGVPICVTTNTEYLPTVLGDGTGGGIIAWQDNRTGMTDIYAQKVDATGAALWNADGIAVSVATGVQENPVIVSDGSGGAIVGWDDFRAGNSFRDLYAQHVGNNSVLPVELSSFTAEQMQSSVRLEWTTATETSNYGFEVQRTTMNNWMKVGFVEGAGTANVPKKYSFVERNPVGGKYFYRLKQIDRNGGFKYSQEVEVEVMSAPKVFALSQNYPNPFNPTTKIEFTLADARFVELKVFDLLGREVATLMNEQKAAGAYSVEWNASNFPSGTYLCRLTAGSFSETKKIVLMK